MRHQPNVLAILLVLPLLAIISAAAVADEVHLTNGRTMFADRTEVLGERLVIYQGTDRFEIPTVKVKAKRPLSARLACHCSRKRWASWRNIPTMITRMNKWTNRH